MARNMSNGETLLDSAFLADNTADTAEFVGGIGHQLGDSVETVSDFASDARPRDGEPRAEIPFLQGFESCQNFLNVQLVLMPLILVRPVPANVRGCAILAVSRPGCFSLRSR